MAARLSGFPAPLIFEYSSLTLGDQYTKRQIFSAWAEMHAATKLILGVPKDWLTWGAIDRYRRSLASAEAYHHQTPVWNSGALQRKFASPSMQQLLDPAFTGITATKK